MEMKEIESIIEKLKSLQHYHLDAGTGYNAGLLSEITDLNGEWIKWEDLQKIISSL